VTVRFSDSGGLPDVADGSAGANPHGMSIKFHLPGGTDTDMVINSLKFFRYHWRGLPGSAAGDQRESAQCAEADQSRSVHGEPPERAKAFATVSTPGSLQMRSTTASTLSSFQQGRTQAGCALHHGAGEVVHLTPPEAGKKAPDFLVDELPKRIAQKPVVFHLKAQLAAAGDQTKDRANLA